MSTRIHMTYLERVQRGHNHMGLCTKGCGRPANNARQICRPCNTQKCLGCERPVSPSIVNVSGRCRDCAKKHRKAKESYGL